MLKLKVPRDQVMLFDLRVWNRMLKLSYVGESVEEEQAFESRLEQIGASDKAQVFNSSFFPLVRREIQNSWMRLFDSSAQCPESYIQAGAWELKKEWIVEKNIL